MTKMSRCSVKAVHAHSLRIRAAKCTFLLSVLLQSQNYVTKMMFSLRADSQEAFAHWELAEGTASSLCWHSVKDHLSAFPCDLWYLPMIFQLLLLSLYDVLYTFHFCQKVCGNIEWNSFKTSLCRFSVTQLMVTVAFKNWTRIVLKQVFKVI